MLLIARRASCHATVPAQSDGQQAASTTVPFTWASRLPAKVQRQLYRVLKRCQQLRLCIQGKVQQRARDSGDVILSCSGPWPHWLPAAALTANHYQLPATAVVGKETSPSALRHIACKPLCVRLVACQFLSQSLPFKSGGYLSHLLRRHVCRSCRPTQRPQQPFQQRRMQRQQLLQHGQILQPPRPPCILPCCTAACG